MTKAAEAHVALARRVIDAMEAFARARRLEAASAGAVLPQDPPELTAGLVCGFVRAYRRIEGVDRQVASKATRYLGRAKPAYAHALRLLSGELGNEVIAIWADLAEAVTEATRRSDDPMAAMLDFATLVRRYGLLDDDDHAGDASDAPMDATENSHGHRRASAQPRRLH